MKATAQNKTEFRQVVCGLYFTGNDIKCVLDELNEDNFKGNWLSHVLRKSDVSK